MKQQGYLLTCAWTDNGQLFPYHSKAVKNDEYGNPVFEKEAETPIFPAEDKEDAA